uniref:Uncharacterized protein n=1 Tax=Tetradesmus obliquus TaxID=3088 RepID=A0A383VYW1_TETOB
MPMQLLNTPTSQATGASNPIASMRGAAAAAVATVTEPQHPYNAYAAAVAAFFRDSVHAAAAAAAAASARELRLGLLTSPAACQHAVLVGLSLDWVHKVPQAQLQA